MVCRSRYLLASGVLGASFLILAALIAFSGKSSPLVEWDTKLFLAVNDSHYQPLNGPMIFLTLYGREVFWAAVVATLFFFGGRMGRTAATVMGISMLVLIPATLAGKEVVGRVRPYIPASDFLLAPDTQEAFPSGHATIVAAGAAGLAAMYRSNARQIALSMGCAIEAALVCFSRVYVGGHYPADVIGGILLGVSVTFAFVSISSTIENRILIHINRALGSGKKTG